MPVLTCIEGTNANLLPVVLGMYVKQGSRIADVTFGNGVFWRGIHPLMYDLVASDIRDGLTAPDPWSRLQVQGGVDFRRLPYESGTFDAVVFDPPYMNGGSGVKESINKCYNNTGNMCHENVMALYLAGMLEARRVLRRQGILFVKCQPAVADHKQHMTHAHIMVVAPMIGFRVEDEFVLRQTTVPLMRHKTQQHARKNHSYLLVLRWVR